MTKLRNPRHVAFKFRKIYEMEHRISERGGSDEWRNRLADAANDRLERSISPATKALATELWWEWYLRINP